ncbi:unnamed protein product [Spirodela intermedia]|uniref:F-box domain-containing protein n=1 Tax=Spirodela intermedia TaxID=51605 RepID=A0A7I8IDK6_SPIIN|nr:unnamed protein product [Spirodela intermedia]CAA6655846.1 unnamed protein product [Spirodela intermedia]
MESATPRRSLPRVAESSLECFSHGISDLIRKKNSRKVKEIVPTPAPAPQFALPDDLLEVCLLRLPFASLQAARLVCKKWLHLTTSPQFLHLRSRDFTHHPWLFLFGITRSGSSAGEIHALDTSLNQWHTIRADLLAGRFLFSVAAVGSDIYVVGGYSNSADAAALSGRSSLKTHRGVLVFSPLTGKWRKASPLRVPRSGPILGVLKVSSSSSFLQSHRRLERRHLKRPKLKEYLNEVEESTGKQSSSEAVGRKTNEEGSRFLLIAAGGRGSWDEPLDSVEVYDPVADQWTAIGKLPEDLGGAACSGAACGGMFYVYSEANRLARYDPERGLWAIIETSRPPHGCTPTGRRSSPPATAACSCSGVSWGDGDRRLGGCEKALRKLWELDLDLMAWAEVASHPDAPMDMNAVFFAERSRIYGIEMFKIFGQVLDFLTSCDVSGREVKWNHISTQHSAHPAAASSCSTKSMVVLRL